MKCAGKVLCPVFAAIGVFVGCSYVKGASIDTVANWMILGYALIGFAVGAVIAGIASCMCKGKCPVSSDKCDTGACEKEHCHDDKKGGCH